MMNAIGRALVRVAAAACLITLSAPGAPAPAAGKSCKDCHADIAKVLPAAHPKTGGQLGACLACHKPDVAGRTAKNAFSTAMHRAHAHGPGTLACATCHLVKASGAIGVQSGKVVLVADAASFEAATRIMTLPDGASWTGGQHADRQLSCASCHGAGVPKAGAEVANGRCLSCHGPLQKLVDRTTPAQFADRNPHHSHLGDIACTTCHRGHEASAVYCLDCHPKFEMQIRGAARR